MNLSVALIAKFQDSEFPEDTGVNPYLSQVKGASGHLTRTGGFRLSNTFQAHSHAVSGYVYLMYGFLPM